jgi:hypothetical protein
MVKVNVVRIPKRVTWTSHIEGLEVGRQFYADYSQLNTISSLISGRIKLKHPERVIKTEKETVNKVDYLKVWREEDLCQK